MKSHLAIAMAALMLLGGAAQAQPNGASPRDSRPARPARNPISRCPTRRRRNRRRLPNATTGSGTNLSDKLAQSDGVLCPPNVDPGIKAPTPEVGKMPVIPPPGSPGGDPSVRPK